MDMSIGDRIKQARKAAKISQQELAKMIGADQSSVSDLERGKTSSSAIIASYARALKVNPYWLETGRGKADLSFIAPTEIAINHHDEINQVIDMMNKTDQRGRVKVLIAVQDAITTHNAWMMSLPQPVESALDVAKRLAATANDEISEINRVNDAHKTAQTVKNGPRKDKHR